MYLEAPSNAETPSKYKRVNVTPSKLYLEAPSNAETPSKYNRVNIQPPKEQNCALQHTRVEQTELFHTKGHHSRPQNETPKLISVLTFRQARANGPPFPS
jgi:hypothetical protein